MKILCHGVSSDVPLDRVGRKLFGKKWLGIFASDVKANVFSKNITTGLNYSIINVDGSGEPGSHWLSVIFDTKSDLFYIWDSYARKSTKLIPKFAKMLGYRYIDINKKGDQGDEETNCGARSMAFILFVKKHGLKFAHHI